MDKNFWNQVKVQPSKPKKYFVTVEGKKIEVSLEEKLRIDKFGSNNFMIKNDKIVAKPIQKVRGVIYAQWKSCDDGYEFVDGHMYWPTGKVTKGKNFKYES